MQWSNISWTHTSYLIHTKRCLTWTWRCQIIKLIQTDQVLVSLVHIYSPSKGYTSQAKCQCLHQAKLCYHRYRPMQCCRTIGCFKSCYQNSWMRVNFADEIYLSELNIARIAVHAKQIFFAEVIKIQLKLPSQAAKWGYSAN